MSNIAYDPVYPASHEELATGQRCPEFMHCSRSRESNSLNILPTLLRIKRKMLYIAHFTLLPGPLPAPMQDKHAYTHGTICGALFY